MTGFGKATGTFGNKQIIVEIKSVNSRQLDLSMKSPAGYYDLEAEIRTLLTQHLERGKVYCNITTEQQDAEPEVQINRPLMASGYRTLKEIEETLGIEPSKDYLSLLLRLPDVLKGVRSEVDQEEFEAVRGILLEAIDETNRYRDAEGKELGRDLLERVGIIGRLLQKVVPLEEGRITRLREKLLKELKNLQNQSVDNNRFEQEIIYYLEKLDITEEKVRLQHHLDFFREVMESREANGRKLGFIAQEIGREVNTLGSKANDAAIQRIVVDMKDELEKIKEQLLNLL